MFARLGRWCFRNKWQTVAGWVGLEADLQRLGSQPAGGFATALAAHAVGNHKQVASG